MDLSKLRLAGADTIQGKVERRLLAGERLNAHDVAAEYGCHWTNLSVAMNTLKNQGIRFKKHHLGERRYEFDLDVEPPTVLEIDFSKAREWQADDHERRLTELEDWILRAADLILARRESA